MDTKRMYNNDKNNNSLQGMLIALVFGGSTIAYLAYTVYTSVIAPALVTLQSSGLVK